MATDDSMFDSGHQPVYRRERSREISQDEIDEMERRARKEGKRDIILSQLVEQQSETANTLKDVNTRLTRGDGELKQLKQDNNELAEFIRKIGDQSESTARLLDKHLVGYNNVVTNLNNQIQTLSDNVGKIDDKVKSTSSEFEAHAQKASSRWKSEDRSNSFFSGIIGQVVSSIITMVVIGGLVAYLAKDKLFSGSSQTQQSNQPQQSNQNNSNP